MYGFSLPFTNTQQQKPIPQHALINAHFTPVATATTIPASAAPTTINSATSTTTTKQTSISDIVAASGVPAITATPTATANSSTAHSVTSSVRTTGSVNTASVSQRGGEEGITFLHSNAPIHSTPATTVVTAAANPSKQTAANSAVKANGASYSTQNAVRSVATGKGQPSFGAASMPSPTTTSATTTAASSVGKNTFTAVPSTTTGQPASQPSKRKAEDGNPVFRSVLSESAAANATGTANGNNSHKKMRSNSEDMAIIAPPPKVIEIIEID